MVRRPIVAGRFYPADIQGLTAQVQAFLAHPAEENGFAADRPWAMMLPHAGYMFCGRIIGQTLAGQRLPHNILILCPNHTGRGAPLGVWPAGAWLTPMGPLSVDCELAAALIKSNAGFEADMLSHTGEHSIEVLLPFLQIAAEADLQITPVCVGTQNEAMLKRAGRAMGHILAARQAAGKESLVIISSDMNHYEDEATTLAKDDLALAKALACDPQGLLTIVRQEKISMCGAGPLALALFAARAMGRAHTVLTGHETSARVSGDRAHTVGYAGLRFYLEPSGTGENR